MRVAPSFTLAVGESSEEGEQDDAQRKREDVSAKVLDADGSDGRGAGAHDRGARGAEPPSGETTEVSPSSRNNHGEALEAAGASFAATAVAAIRLLGRRRRKMCLLECFLESHGDLVAETEGSTQRHALADRSSVVEISRRSKIAVGEIGICLW